MADVRPDDLHLANWREAPRNRWAFRHTRELFPTMAIRAARRVPEPEAPSAYLDLSRLDVPMPGEGRGTLAAFLDATRTDELVVLAKGRLAYAWSHPESDAQKPHLLFSVSKSVTALIAGILEAHGRLDPEAPIATYVPEILPSAYGTASVRHLLDMTVSLDFEEAYLDPDSDFARYRRAMLWNPSEPGVDPGDLLGFFPTLRTAGHPHGKRFFYASPNSDLLGLVVERAGGAPFGELVERLLWQPMGAMNDGHVTLDRRGTARAAGGISATGRDLARLGDLVHRGGEGIVPRPFVEDLWTGGDREAWLADAEPSVAMPDARYRSQWYAVGDGDDSLCAIGIHGQWIMINPRRETVIVRLSSQETPLSDPIKIASLAAFAAIACAV